jgi:hypothetical protein
LEPESDNTKTKALFDDLYDYDYEDMSTMQVNCEVVIEKVPSQSLPPIEKRKLPDINLLIEIDDDQT